MSGPATFISIFARNCTVRRIEPALAQGFLEANHRFGFSKCRYNYGLFVRRKSGASSRNDRSGSEAFPEGTLVAVSSFSQARHWVKEGTVVRSHEWVRYASLDGVRVLGGMGKMLKAFIDDKHPDDIMSYAPQVRGEEGDAYVKLGFVREGWKEFAGGRSIKFRLTVR